MLPQAIHIQSMCDIPFQQREKCKRVENTSPSSETPLVVCLSLPLNQCAAAIFLDENRTSKLHNRSQRNVERKQKGGFVKGWVWQMYPRSGFWYRHSVFVPSFRFLVPSFRFLYPRSCFLRSEMLQNKSSPNFSNFHPEFRPEYCSEFAPKFLRSFHAASRGKRRPEKNSPKISAIFQCKIPRQIQRKNLQEFSGERAK